MNKKFILILTAVLCVAFNCFTLSNTYAIAATKTTVYLGGETPTSLAQWYFSDQDGGNPGGWTNVGVGWDRTINEETVTYYNLQVRWDTTATPSFVPKPSGSDGHDFEVTLYFNGANINGVSHYFNYVNYPTPDYSTFPSQYLTSCLNFACSVSNVEPSDSSMSISFDLDGSNMPTNGWINLYTNYGSGSPTDLPWFLAVNGTYNTNTPYTTGINGIEITYWTNDYAVAQLNELQAQTNYMATDEYRNRESEAIVINSVDIEAVSSQIDDTGILGIKNNLLNNFNLFVTGITAVPAMTRNCTIPDLNINGLRLTNLNFCSFTMPTPIIAITSVGAFLALSLLGFNLFKRIINFLYEVVS